MRIVTLSSKHQITIPRSLLRELQVSPRSKMLIKAEGDAIVVKPLKKSVVDEVAGSLAKYVSPSKRGVPFSKIMEITKNKVAAKLAKEGLER